MTVSFDFLKKFEGPLKDKLGFWRISESSSKENLHGLYKKFVVPGALLFAIEEPELFTLKSWRSLFCIEELKLFYSLYKKMSLSQSLQVAIKDLEVFYLLFLKDL